MSAARIPASEAGFYTEMQFARRGKWYHGPAIKNGNPENFGTLQPELDWRSVFCSARSLVAATMSDTVIP